MNKKVYKSKKSEKAMKELYNSQLNTLGIKFQDVYVDTMFGKTHLIKFGNPTKKPVLMFHGGNITTPYYLRDFITLQENHLIYAVDTIGHPGKSGQKVLSAKNLEYGIWAADVIENLGYKQMICMGSSFGAGILTKLMCVAPRKIDKAVLMFPAGFNKVSKAKIMLKMGLPMTLYLITKSEKWLIKSIMPMAIDDAEIDQESLRMVKETFNHVIVKSGMPSDVEERNVKGYKAPTLLIAGGKDVLFPGEKVIKNAKRIIPGIETCLLEDSGHLTRLSIPKHEEVLRLIKDFIT